MSARNGKPKMQRAHFQLVADVLRDAALSAADREALVVAFGRRFRDCNPQFNSQRFHDAAIPPEERHDDE